MEIKVYQPIPELEQAFYSLLSILFFTLHPEEQVSAKYFGTRGLRVVSTAKRRRSRESNEQDPQLLTAETLRLLEGIIRQVNQLIESRELVVCYGGGNEATATTNDDLLATVLKIYQHLTGKTVRPAVENPLSTLREASPAIVETIQSLDDQKLPKVLAWIEELMGIIQPILNQATLAKLGTREEHEGHTTVYGDERLVKLDKSRRKKLLAKAQELVKLVEKCEGDKIAFLYEVLASALSQDAQTAIEMIEALMSAVHSEQLLNFLIEDYPIGFRTFMADLSAARATVIVPLLPVKGGKAS